jgi:hypothetical protein
MSILPHGFGIRRKYETLAPSPKIALPALGDLSFSSTDFITSVAQSGTIIGATDGSTISSSDLPAGLAINSASRTWAWTGVTGSSGTFHLTETLVGYVNSPLTSSIDYTISAGTVAGKLDFSLAVNSGLLALLEDV